MEKGYIMKRSSRKDYLRRIYPRYRQASPLQKRRILDEFCANCGYHRKYAIRLLNGPPPGPRHLRLPLDLHLEGRLGSGGLSLVGATEGAPARVAALDPPSLLSFA